MKKILFLTALCGFFSSQLHAICFLPEVKAAYFYPLDSRFRKIYSGGGLYSFEATFSCWDCFYPWISAGGFWKSGRSIGEKDKTEIVMIPLGVGLKYLFCCGCFNPYIGAGLAVTYLHTDDHSPFVKKNNSGWGVGGIAKVGNLYYFCESFFIDIFADYTYMKVDFDKVSDPFVIGLNANVSGFSFGGGLGFCF